jgi:hypothetical protein
MDCASAFFKLKNKQHSQERREREKYQLDHSNEIVVAPPRAYANNPMMLFPPERVPGAPVGDVVGPRLTALSHTARSSHMHLTLDLPGAMHVAVLP